MEPTATQKKKVLYIEDEPFFASTISNQLSEAGYDVQTAVDGESGLELAQKDIPDLVLLDITLPKMDGKEVLRRLKDDEKTKSIPVIILSNLSALEDEREAAALGAQAFFVKALSLPSEIVDVVRVQLSKH